MPAKARFLAAWLCLALGAHSGAAQILERVQRAVDGDTLVLATGEVIRVRGIDAPELHPCRCEQECALGVLARHWAHSRTASGVVLGRRGSDRYGRTLATVTTADGSDLAQELIARGLARPYDGRGRRQPWCP